MNKGFWDKLKKPIIILAPMADVTDSAFRQIIAKYSRPHGPDVFYTEFVSADGLCHEQAKEKLMRELYFTPVERPLVAQIFSSKPEKIFQAAKLVQELGFDGLDINMGCPDRNVEKQGAGAALIKTPTLAKEIIAAAKEGADKLPVAVKTRVGYSRIDELENWAEALLETKPVAITFHLRTRKEMSKVPAHWDLMHIPVEMAKGTGVMIFGNGDVETVAEGKEKAKETGADGVMIGRGIFGNPWLWSGRDIPIEEKLSVLVEHTKLFEGLYRETDTNKRLFNGHTKSFHVMKKHFKAYVGDFPEATTLRTKLMETENAGEVEEIITNFLRS